MQTFRIHFQPLQGRASQKIQSRPVRRVQSPVLLHQNLDLKIKQSPQDALWQIAECVEKYFETGRTMNQLVLAIDITCPPELIVEGFAEDFALSILSALDQLYPSLRDRFVGISDDEACLPLHDLLRTGKLALEEIDNQHLFVFE